MDSFSGRGTRQAVPQRESVTVRPEPVVTHHESAPSRHAPASKRPQRRGLAIIVALVGLALLAGLLAWQFFAGKAVPGVNAGQYQAVQTADGRAWSARRGVPRGAYKDHRGSRSRPSP